MAKHKIKTATAVYTGGGIYIYYGQLESGLYFRTADEYEVIDICNADTSDESADYAEFYEAHSVEEIADTSKDFQTLWNAIISHILNGGATLGRWSNYSRTDLENRIIK